MQIVLLQIPPPNDFSHLQHKNPSVLFCRPYDAKIADEPWHIYYSDGEEVEVSGHVVS